jgi:hypothetical protein
MASAPRKRRRRTASLRTQRVPALDAFYRLDETSGQVVN